MTRPRRIMSGTQTLTRDIFPEKSLFFFDFDGVLIEQTEEKLYQLEETDGERTKLEELARSVGIEPSIFGSTQYLRHLVFQAMWEGPSNPTPITTFAMFLTDPYFIITARSGRHAQKRMLNFLDHYELEPQEIFCLGRSSKGEHLRHMLKAFPDHYLIFFDDTPKHIEAAEAVGDPRLVPILVSWHNCFDAARTLREELLRDGPHRFRDLYECRFPPPDRDDPRRKREDCGIHPALADRRR